MIADQWQVYVYWNESKGREPFPYSVKLYSEEFAGKVAAELNRMAGPDAEYSFKPKKVQLWVHMPKTE